MATPAEKAAQLRAFNDSLLDNDPEMVDAEGATKERLEVNRPPQQAIDQESISCAAGDPSWRSRRGRRCSSSRTRPTSHYGNRDSRALPQFWEGTSPPSGVSS